MDGATIAAWVSGGGTVIAAGAAIAAALYTKRAASEAARAAQAAAGTSATATHRRSHIQALILREQGKHAIWLTEVAPQLGNMCLEDRPVLEPNAAGIDIGAREIFVAVPPDRDENPVRVCTTFTEDLERMADWLVACGITTVAMESTGVYWIPLYDILESDFGAVDRRRFDAAELRRHAEAG